MSDSRILRPRAPTIYDVAATAGVSHTTVSRAVNGGDGITDDTRRRILEIVERVGYEPNSSARVLAGRLRPQIAAVVPRGADARSAAALVGALVRAARTRDHALTIVGVEPSDERSLAAAAERIGEPGIRGTVVVAAAPGPRLLEVVHGARHVVLGGPGSADGTPGAGVAQALALAHLAGLGHRVVACVAAPDVRVSADRRGLTLVPFGASATAEAAFQAARGAALPPGCTAVLSPTVSFAAGFLAGLRGRGIRVPDDVSIVSLEDHADAAHLSPALTAVGEGAEDVAHRAVTTLIDVIESGSVLSRAVSAEPRLRVRASTGPAREWRDAR